MNLFNSKSLGQKVKSFSHYCVMLTADVGGGGRS